MSDALTKAEAVAMWTPEQRELIKRTVAPGATDDELAMFLHIAQRSGLDPLRKQVHFSKIGGRVAVIADINGLQARAAKEPDFRGIQHAVVYEKDEFVFDHKASEVVKHVSNPFGQNGKPVGAWAIVHRKDMLPFVSLVTFSEYDNGNNPLWKTKPRVMIDKVAKSTALRLAYPEQLGGIYEAAEGLEDAGDLPPEPPPGQAKRSTSDAIRERLEAKMLAANADSAKPPSARSTIIDMAANETEAEAERRAAVASLALSPPVLFGPHKNKPVDSLTSDEIAESLKYANDNAAKTKGLTPENKRAIEDNIAAIKAEQRKRIDALAADDQDAAASGSAMSDTAPF